MTKDIRPSVKRVRIFCEGCGLEAHNYFTNKEIWDGTKIEQPCKNCDRFTRWTQIKPKTK